MGLFDQYGNEEEWYNRQRQAGLLADQAANPPPPPEPERFQQGRQILESPPPRQELDTYTPHLGEKDAGRSKWHGNLLGMLEGGAEGGFPGAIFGAMTGGERWRDRKMYDNYLEELAGEQEPGSQEHQALMARRYAGEKYAGTSRPWWSNRGTSGTWSSYNRPIAGRMIQPSIRNSRTGEIRPDPGAEPYSRDAPRDERENNRKDSDTDAARRWLEGMDPGDRAKTIASASSKYASHSPFMLARIKAAMRKKRFETDREHEEWLRANGFEDPRWQEPVEPGTMSDLERSLVGDGTLGGIVD